MSSPCSFAPSKNAASTIDELETLVSSQTANPLEVIEWYRTRINFDAAHRNSLKAYVSVCDDRPTPDENPGQGELFGIPVVVKDNMEVAGLPMTCGSIALRDYIPEQDCEVVQRLRSAGAFILGKGSMSEFAWGITDTLGSAVGGFTRNPYDTNYACGGSSGGSAVAVSANLAAAGLGTDTGCSIRAPASMTGLVGVRPTFGLVSMAGIMPMSRFMDTVGPLARTSVDAARVLKVIARPRPNSGRSGQTVDWSFSLDAVREAPASGYRVGNLQNLAADGTTDPGVSRVYRSFLRDLEKSGVAHVTPITPSDWPRLDIRPWYRLYRYDVDVYLAAARPGDLDRKRGSPWAHSCSGDRGRKKGSCRSRARSKDGTPFDGHLRLEAPRRLGDGVDA